MSQSSIDVDVNLNIILISCRMIEHEVTISRTSENTTILHKVQESGVKLFYHLIECYSEEAALCLPTKQLITTCLEKLGQVSIIMEIS